MTPVYSCRLFLDGYLKPSSGNKNIFNKTSPLQEYAPRKVCVSTICSIIHTEALYNKDFLGFSEREDNFIFFVEEKEDTKHFSSLWDIIETVFFLFIDFN